MADNTPIEWADATVNAINGCSILSPDRGIIFSAHGPEGQRFATRVSVRDDDCWEWTGARNKKGYGRFGSGEMAHRAALRIIGRPVPDGLEVDHLCRNRACVNPDHLEAVTHRENLLRGETITARAAARTQCPAGHPLAGDNVAIREGKRRCRECDRLRNNARYEPTTNRRRRRHLTPREVADILARLAAGEPQSSIAADMNLSQSTVSNVKNGRNNYGR